MQELNECDRDGQEEGEVEGGLEVGGDVEDEEGSDEIRDDDENGEEEEDIAEEEDEDEEGEDEVEEDDDKTAMSRQMQMILEDMDQKSSVSDVGDVLRSSVSDAGEVRSIVSDADQSADEEDEEVFPGRDTQQAVLDSVKNMSSSNSNSSPSTKEVSYTVKHGYSNWFTLYYP